MKNPEYLVISGIILISIGLLISLFIFQSKNSEPVNDKEKGYLGLNNETMICNFTHICFYMEGEWHTPAYGTGANLIKAYDYKLDNATKKDIKNFFERDKIILVINTTPGIVETMPFAHYLGYYYFHYKNEEKKIIPITPKDYNSTEPALMIYGPDPAMKDSITSKDGNLIVKTSSRKSIKFLLGKIFLVIVS